MLRTVGNLEQSRFARTFTDASLPRPDALELPDCVGQRRATFRFDVVNAITGYRWTAKPVRDSPPTLDHDTTRTIKRQLSGLEFGATDTARINPISDRIELFMLLDDVPYPLGRYVFNDDSRKLWTSGSLASGALYDEGFIVDQPLTTGLPKASALSQGIIAVPALLAQLLGDLPITYTAEASGFVSTGSWSVGTSRGNAVEQVAIDGDYFSPWFDNTGVMRFIRTFDPATVIPTFDLDGENRVFQDPPPLHTSDLITAPNRFVVISNGSSDTFDTPIVGTYDVPSSAPHSIANRGFVVAQVEDRPLETASQAATVARNIGIRSTIFERVELRTPPDPRHDSYDVLRWQGSNWLEISWSLTLAEGEAMVHTARKAYNA